MERGKVVQAFVWCPTDIHKKRAMVARRVMDTYFERLPENEQSRIMDNMKLWRSEGMDEPHAFLAACVEMSYAEGTA